MIRSTARARLVVATILGAFASMLVTAACERPRFDREENAPPSPNASILPAPLATDVVPAAAKTNDPAATSIALPTPEPMRGDQTIPADYVGPKETSGLVLVGEWRWADVPPPPKAPEVHAEGIAAARKQTTFRWQISVSEAGRLRIVFDSRAFPVPHGTELRARWDRYGHALVFPNGSEYRPVPAGALRAFFGDRRLDVLPLVPGEVVSRGPTGNRLGHPLRRIEVASKMGTLVLDLAHLPDAGVGAALLCRTFVELVDVDPSTPACTIGDLPVRAQLTWPTGAGTTFEVLEISKKTDLSASDLLVPPANATFSGTLLPPVGSGVLLGREEAAALRVRPIDVGPPQPGAPTEGILARNASDALRYLLVDGVPAAWVLPNGEQIVLGPPKGRYVAQWRTFLGDAIDPPRVVEVPARLAVGETLDAGVPAPAKSK